MNKRKVFTSFVIIFLVSAFFVIAYQVICSLRDSRTHTKPIPSLEQIEHKYHDQKPSEWSEDFEGITSRLIPRPWLPRVYLTFDACGGEYDKALIDYLIQEQIPATLFINSRWIDKHYDAFMELAQNPLFSIQNHGTLHRPLSINGREIYHIKGTNSIQEVYEEIMQNDALITKLTGTRPRYFRSGTAYYDDIAVKIAKDLGYQIGGFDVLGDGGATFSTSRIVEQAKKARDGSILIYHFNKPQSDTLAGIKKVVPLLRQQGFAFEKL